MPPRYAYWTVLVDDQPTAFRSGSQEELMPTFKRLQQKHASAKMMWWQNGKLWESRLDAQEAMRARGEIGRRSDPRQEDHGGRPFKPAGGRYSDRAPRASERRAERDPSGKLDWKPKSGWKAKPRGPRPAAAGKLEWKPKSEGSSGSRIPDPGSREKRKWVPKEEYKKSQGIEAKRDKNWRPGGEHKDPRQKYKDAKKAKWGRFKQTVRKRWEAKGKKTDK